MKINIITTLDNRAGLETEYRLLCALLAEEGHDVAGVHVKTGRGSRPADLNVWLELIDARFIPLAPHNWVFPNPEFFERPWLDLIGDFRICAKTRDAFRIFKMLGYRDVWLTGFASRDLFRPETPRRDAWLHVAGRSLFKGTDAVLRAWNDNPSLPPLTVISALRHWPATRGVTFVHDAREEQYIELLNRHRYHILPSAYEGFGHALHEGMMVNATVVTTDAPPMNEFGCLAIVKSHPVREHHLGMLHHVAPVDVAEAVELATGCYAPRLFRDLVSDGNTRFKQTLHEMLKGVGS